MATGLKEIHRQVSLPVGSIVHSLLTEAQFQAINGTEWVLATGQEISDTEYNRAVGINPYRLPDLRGQILRGKNNGRADGKQNPDVTLSATRTAGSTNITIATSSSERLVVGMQITGTGIPTGTTIQSITSATVVVMSAAASASGTSSLVFSGDLPVGSFQDQELPNIKGTADATYAVFRGNNTGALVGAASGGAVTTSPGYTTNISKGSLTLDASLHSPIYKDAATEVRVKNVTVNIFIKIN